ncbi:MAG: DUF4010 domain-containing protein [Steroidobacteraceae bacterium]|nr:DUF4010 domain-containing protein [Steroidobacteraceae bacterium]MDW8260060.1 DUF4010 domain-containing protein [Gammaproteobacteria bacterium]
MNEQQLLGLAAALGLGLLVGGERELSHTTTQRVATAGVRTFALVALLGALAALVDDRWALAVCGLIVGALAALSYRSSHAIDPGITTEIALVIVFWLGAFAMRDTALATGLGVVVAILLRSRAWLHDFVRNRLTEREVNDALLLAAAALVILPVLPDRIIDPWGVLNLRTIWALAVLFMAINGLGYIARRALGAGYGLALAGLASGFVSSAATHSAMGTRARAQPALLGPAVAGAALSSVATVVQLAIVIGVAAPALLEALALPLALSGAVAVVYGTVFLRRSLRTGADAAAESGRAFNPWTAIAFASFMSAVVIASALLVRWLGSQGAVLSAGLAGFADTHAAAASASLLAQSGTIDQKTASIAILTGFTTNALIKVTLAAWSGGTRFLLWLAPGIALMVIVAWLGFAPSIG